VRDLKQRAYFGVSAALSVGPSITRPMRPTYQINSEDEGRKAAVQGNAPRKVGIIKAWVDDLEATLRHGVRDREAHS
jgi:hypothetical protein